METKLVPYLNFNGNTKEAMEFYHSVFGGELTMQTFEESGQTGYKEYNDKIMHAHLQSEGIVLMASEGKPGEEVKFGDNISLSVNGEDEAKLKAYFEKLAVGGKVLMSLEKQFWGDTFGMLTDKFGINWMVNISKK